MPKPAKLKRGRPKIKGKHKYTLNLTQSLVDSFYKVEGNLSAFVDVAMARRILEASK